MFLIEESILALESTEMDARLADFHINCKKEFNVLMKSFNILFYGYGSKRSMLMRMFPSAFYFNCRLLKPREILNELLAQLRSKSKELDIKGASISSMHELDNLIGLRKEKYKLIIANFDFDAMEEFSNLKNFAILGTIESIDVRFSPEDIERFNFIFRDLTTFEPYEDEIADIQLKATKIESSFNVIRNVPKNSRLVLKEILQFATEVIGLDELFERTKRKLFLTSKSLLFTMISEFVDHRILRIKDNTDIIICLSLTERKRLLENWSQFE